MTDRISVLGLEVRGGIGVYDHEKGVDQRLVIDVELEVDLRAAAKADALAQTVDYDQVAEICREVVSARHHELIETVAETIAERMLALAETVQGVTVRVDKPGAVPDAQTVRVELSRRRSS